VISVGTDMPQIKENIHNVSKNFCSVLGITVVDSEGFVSRSELEGKYNDIFENGLNPGIEKRLNAMARKLLGEQKQGSP